MKKLITLFALAFVVVVSAQEKDSKTNRQKHKRNKMEIFETLNLTEQQKSEIKVLFDEQRAEYKARKQNLASKTENKAELNTRKKTEFTEAERAEFKTKKEAKRKATDAKLQTILTKEQFEKYVSERKKRHAEMRQKRATFQKNATK